MKLYKCPCYLYCNYILSITPATKIAKENNCDNKTIYYWLKKNNINIRSNSDSKKGTLNPMYETHYPNPNKIKGEINDKKWLYHQYWTLEKSTIIIAKENNTNKETIRRRMIELKIPCREDYFYIVRENGGKHSNEYYNIHYWARHKKKKPLICEICNKKKDKNGNSKLELSNKTGKLLKDMENFQYVHSYCHWKYDLKNKIVHEK